MLCICSVEERNIRSEQCIYCLFVSVFNFYPHHQFSNEIHNNIQQDFFFIHSKKEFQSEIYERHQKTQWAKNARIITSKAEINLFRKKILCTT